MIAPDLRGFGDSALAPDDRYDVAAHRARHAALRATSSGTSACVVCAGDLGGVVAQDLSLRFEGLVERLVPVQHDPAAAAERRAAGRSRARRAGRRLLHPPVKDADGLAAELDTPEKRRALRRAGCTARASGPRRAAFTREDVDFMTEPFADAERFRASIANYEYAGGPRTAPEPPRLLEPNPTPTLILYGPEDHVIPRDFPERMEAAFPEPRRPVRRRRAPAISCSGSAPTC